MVSSLGKNIDFSPLVTFAQENLTIDSTAGGVGFTASKYSPSGATNFPATCATVNVETAPIRYTLDGTAPTTTVGTLKNVGDTFVVTGSVDIKNFKAIRTTGVSASISVNYSH